MIDPRTILEFLKSTEKTKRDFVDVKCLNAENKSYVYHIPKEEAYLSIYLKSSIFSKLTETECSHLISLIDEFGSQRYSDGYDNATNDY